GNAVIQSVCRDNIRPDLILMDCLMPSLDGFEATRLIRADEQNRQLPRVPIVALTASALSEDCDRCLSAGMDGYLSKPFTEDQLIAMLAAYLPSARAARETRMPLPAAC
ncbi:MAG TPA: response regulator, partial [Aquabacterium sp.]|nr:response regulator [Aquabacterium sp.]